MKDLDKERVKFCLLATQRTGSTWLMDLIAKHPDVRAFGEVFLNRPQDQRWYDAKFEYTLNIHEFTEKTNGRRPVSVFRFLNYLEGRRSQRRALGFKMMYSHVSHFPEIIPKLVKDRYRIIHLVRTNLLHVWISHLFMMKKGRVHARRRMPKEEIYVNPNTIEKILSRLNSRVAAFRWFLRLLPNRHIEISYEDACQNPQRVRSRIESLLSIPHYTGYKSEFVRVNPTKDWERIANYREIKETLEGTEFEEMLEVQPQPAKMHP